MNPEIKKLLAPGGKGQVGSYIRQHAETFGFDVYAPDIEEIDITDPASVDSVFSRFKPDIVINCAAFTAVDKAETDRSLAEAINIDGPRVLASQCTPDIPFLHISTDYVFDGQEKEPYTEDHHASPINTYGETKLKGEAAALELHEKTAVLRTAWVYSPTHPNFLQTMLRVGREQGAVSVVNDQHGTPTHAEDIALTLLKMARQILQQPDNSKQFGLFHYTGEGQTTWHRFAAAIFEELAELTGEEVSLSAISTNEFPTPAKRAAYSVLSNEKIKQIYGLSPTPWEPRVRETVNIVIQSESKAS